MKEKKLKIAYVVERFPDRAETFIIDKIIYLKEKGHKIIVFTQSIGELNMHPDKLKKIELKKELVKLPTWDRFRLKDFTKGIYSTFYSPIKALKLLIKILRSPNYKGRKIHLFNLTIPFLLENFDLVHFQFAYSGARYMDVPQILGIPFLVSLRGSDVLRPRQKEKNFYKELFKKADKLIAVCEFLKKKTIELGADEEKISVVYTEKDLDYFYFSQREEKLKKPIILTVSRLHWQKGLSYGIEAMRILKNEGVEFEYWIAGEGQEKEPLEFLVKDMGLENCVKFLGALDHNEVRDVLHKAHIFFMPSLMEGIAGSAIEAQATGLPVVATDVGGIPEAVKNGETGFLVPSRDSRLMAEKLKLLILNPELRIDMGKKARKWVEDRFEKEKLMQKLINIYEEVIEKRK